jgi:hypothetical protein
MFFKPKFFLDLSGDSGDKAAEPATVAPVAPVAPAQPAPAKAAKAAPAEPVAQAAASLTTAEAIAAELAAAQANRPAPSLATFAAECLVPGGANTPRRRRGGANLAGFREIARSYLKS